MKFWSSRLTLPVDDPFWDHHYPGERWGCKCTCEQTDEPVNDLGVHDDIPDTASKGLHGNPGQTGQLFSEDHPYYPKNCGSCPFNKGVRNRMSLFLNKKKDCESCQAVGSAIKKENTIYDIGESLVRLYDLDNNHLLDEVKAITSSKIFKQVEKNIFSAIGSEDNDYERLLAVARKASHRGYTSFILPNPRKGRTPDIILRRKGIFKIYDVKTIVGTNSVSNRLADSVGQTHRILLHITTEYDPRQLAKEIKTYLEDNIDTIEITVLRGNKEITVSRATILDKHFIQKFIMNYKR